MSSKFILNYQTCFEHYRKLPDVIRYVMLIIVTWDLIMCYHNLWNALLWSKSFITNIIILMVRCYGVWNNRYQNHHLYSAPLVLLEYDTIISNIINFMIWH